ncbi:hypothetical protein CkaCkLH20_13313 [Colletotrichum karsti]|uniref:Uncharacterized protein n=1 Tax=Colletotrichum karsti TaxID=1095194 RepID=A0A9P6HVV3_9PEZI|nr:uncharacterized protein CkaCkLH20_13313 [Colletotrichum karsti]KAF9869211.1 hypothetical protein CkaCkLH20_13313 [Colletotrichum karsti]
MANTPPWPASDDEIIPQALYVKAQDHQNELTDGERLLLLTRGDVVGKALAHPDSLTPEEIHQALLWPPPDVVRVNIQRATGGKLSTPSELYAKGKDAMAQGEFRKLLNEHEISLLGRYFHAMDDTTFCDVTMSEKLSEPGVAQAVELISSRLGLEFAIFHAALLYRADQMYRPMRDTVAQLGLSSVQAQGRGQKQIPADIVTAMASLEEQLQPGKLSVEEVAARNEEYVAALRATAPASLFLPSYVLPTSPPITTPPSQADLFGAGPWPPTVTPSAPINMFANATDLSGYSIQPGWSALPNDQKEVYRTRSEKRRQEAWAVYKNAQVVEPTSSTSVPSRDSSGHQRKT